MVGGYGDHNYPYPQRGLLLYIPEVYINIDG